MVKDTCMKAACGININLFFRNEAKTCDVQCANRCMSLIFESAKKQCVELCGCSMNNRAVASGVLNLAANIDSSIVSSSTPRNLYTNILISVVVAAVIGGIVVALRRAKKQTYKSQVIKPSEIKKERKAKILDADEEQNTFVIEEKYERVA